MADWFDRELAESILSAPLMPAGYSYRQCKAALADLADSQSSWRLSADDLSAAASWLAAQPVPADARPAARVAGPLPLDCGPQPP